MAIDITLENLYFEDKEQREAAKSADQLHQLNIDTQKRISWVKQNLALIDETEIWNCHYLAYLLHHGDIADDYKLAHEYASKAVAMGSRVTKWLFAATLDRWLVSQGKKQKYGTQYQILNGEKVYFPSDGTINIEEM